MLNMIKSVTDAFKNASKIAIQRTVGATGDFICDKIADQIIKASR